MPNTNVYFTDGSVILRDCKSATIELYRTVFATKSSNVIYGGPNLARELDWFVNFCRELPKVEGINISNRVSLNQHVKKPCVKFGTYFR